jgi:hypothetical protein
MTLHSSLAADIERLAAAAPLTAGYRFELLRRDEACELIVALRSWYRDISVGSASHYFDENYYEDKVFFSDSPQRDAIVLTLRRDAGLVGMFSCQLDLGTRTIYAGLGVVASEHRGAGIAHAGIVFVEQLAEHLGLGFIYGMATLKHPYAQRAFERAGWMLVGIAPGYDRELIAPGVIKRVYEAVYAKVLGNELLHPQLHNLTPRTRALFTSLFSERPLYVAIHCDCKRSG